MAAISKVNTLVPHPADATRRPTESRQTAAECDPHIRDEIRFVHSELFDDPNCVREILEALPSIERTPAEIACGGGGDSTGEWQVAQYPLLDRDDERLLFLKMNCLRYLAEMRRRRTLLCGCRDRDRTTISNLLDEADQIREMLALCNQRLLKAIIRRLATRSLSREESLSEANLALLRAIDCFNVDKGYHFSTYATHAVRRQLFRVMQGEFRRRAKNWELESEPTIVDVECEWLDVHPAELIGEFLNRLSSRDRRIVELRFGLDGRERGMTFRAIAACMEISAERARQIVNEHCRTARSRYGADLGITGEGE